MGVLAMAWSHRESGLPVGTAQTRQSRVRRGDVAGTLEYFVSLTCTAESLLQR